MEHVSNDYFTTLMDALPTDHPGRKTWKNYLIRLHATVTGNKAEFQSFMRNYLTNLKTLELDVFLCQHGFEEASVPPLQAIRAPVRQRLTPMAINNASEKILPASLNELLNEQCFPSNASLNRLPEPRATPMSSPELPVLQSKTKNTNSDVEDDLQDDSEREYTPKNKDDEKSSDSDSSCYEEDIRFLPYEQKKRASIYSSSEKSSLDEDSEVEGELDSPPKKLAPVRITKKIGNGKPSPTSEIVKPIQIKTKKMKESGRDILLPNRIKKMDKVAKDLPIPIPIRRKKCNFSTKDEPRDKQDLPIRVKTHNKEPSVGIGELEPIKIKKKKLDDYAVPLRVKKKQKYSFDQNAC